MNKLKQTPTKQRGMVMQLEARWDAPCHMIWSHGHPAQQVACQRPSMSHGEGEAPQGGPFPQHWVGMPGCTKTQCTPEMVLEHSPHGCCGGAGAAPLLTRGLISSHRYRETSPPPCWCGWCHREQDKLFKGARSRGSGGKGPRARNAATISGSSLKKPSQKSANLQRVNSALRKPKVLTDYIDGQ